MADPTRAHLALTQQMLATWLGIPRSSVALAETGYQSMPPNTGLQDARLVLATLGLVPHPTGAPPPPPAPPLLPPLPLPPLAEQPLAQRRDYCRHHTQRLRYALGKMRQKAAGYEARYPALPALRAWVGPVKNPEREANWLDNLQQDADYQLRYVCGAGPQRLLEARLAGLECEAELLAETLATPPPAS